MEGRSNGTINQSVNQLKVTVGSAGGLIEFDFDGRLGLWPGWKGLAREKHRPSYLGFRIADFGFFDFLFQSAFRNRHSAIWMPARSMK